MSKDKNHRPFISPVNLILIHFIGCSTSLVKLINILVTIFWNTTWEKFKLNLYDWATPFYYPNKLRTILIYILTIVSLFLFFSLLNYLINLRNKKSNSNSFFREISSDKQSIITYLILLAITNLFIIIPKNTGDIGVRILIWILFFTYPFYVEKISFIKKVKILNQKKWNNTYKIILAVVIVDFILCFSPFIFGKLKIANESFDIPEKTILKSGLVIDNIDFINDNNLFGSRIKYDFRKPISQKSALSSKPTTDEKIKKEFLLKNKFETHWQILNRWVIHHHNHVLGPINEVALGKNIRTIFMQYGWLNTVFLAKTLNLLGGISYQLYFKVLYSFYFIYYFLFIALAFFIFEKKLKYILPLVMFITISHFSIGYQFIMLGPGINPIRHFFDIFTLFFFILYINKSNRYFLTLALTSALVSIVNNPQLGLFLYGAFLVTATTFNINQIKINQKNSSKYKENLIFLGITTLIGFACFRLGNIGSDNITHYFLKGFLGFPINPVILYFSFALFATGYAILIKFFNSRDKFQYIGLFLLLYSQGLFTYYVWGSDNVHLMVIFPILILTFIVILKILIDNNKLLKSSKEIILFILLLSAIVIYLPKRTFHYHAKREFENVFKEHKTYQWTLEKANFVSTMDPNYFLDSIQLIQKYSKQNNIYILSKYDNFIPFLAGKYSAMPYFDVAMYLLSESELTNCVATINTDKPTYLFVDKDINRNFDRDIIQADTPIYGYLNMESTWRVKRMNLLKETFSMVSSNYEAIESSQLLTVYKLK